MSSAPPSPPVPIASQHRVSAFDCGEEALNAYLRKFAVANHQSGYARTFVVCDELDTVIGYYTLTASQVMHEDASERLAKGAARHPIPVVLLARLAVDQTAQGRRLGQSLLLDAIRRVLDAAESLGVRALLVHAKHEQASDFYRRLAGFEPLPGDPLALYLLLKDARRTLARQQTTGA
ncbi:MAG: GNAT family N-acetyltransferase [Verrucomicrobia bacterium]|nr:GNAT family N-acetyltransferase [Verrucomicrobiota bacterium]